MKKKCKHIILFFLAALLISTSPKEKVEPFMLTENNKIIEQENSLPEFLYKIVSEQEWKKSLLEKQVIHAPIDKDFIHLATETQISHVLQKFWYKKDHVILKLASTKLVGCLLYETNPGGSTKYYHLYGGKIPLDAVVDVSVFHAK